VTVRRHFHFVAASRVYAQIKGFHKTQMMDTNIWRGYGVFCEEEVSDVYSDSMERINTGFEHVSRSIVPTRGVNMWVAGLYYEIKISAAFGIEYWCIRSELGQLQSDYFRTEVEADFIVFS
jgi:hypothetical protein